MQTHGASVLFFLATIFALWARGYLKKDVIGTLWWYPVSLLALLPAVLMFALYLRGRFLHRVEKAADPSVVSRDRAV